MINSIRFSKAADKVRVVFDINADTKYDVKQQPNGDIMVDFSEPINKQYLSGINIMMIQFRFQKYIVMIKQVVLL